MTGRLYALVGLLALCACVLGLTYCQGGQGSRSELREHKADAKATAKSVETSRETARRTEVAGAETRHHAEKAQRRIHERIASDPGASARVDPDVMRTAREAYEAAIRASCRVQRTSDCPPASGATE